MTIIISRDLDHEVEDVVSEMNVDCYVKFPNALGISHRCEGTISDNLPWEASVLMISGEEKDLVELAERIQHKMKDKPYTPCLRMMLSPADKFWI